MKAPPRVSVIIPAFNVSPFIRQAVASALGQTVADIEVLVIDDGSTDGTVEQLTEISDPRLRIIRQAHTGVAFSRNAGIHLARAGYIGFLDGDDLWLPHKLEKHLALLEEHPNADLTFSLSRMIDACGRDHGLPLPKLSGIVTFQELLRENLVRTSSSVVLRKEAILRAGFFDSHLVPCEDHDMWLRIAMLRPDNIWSVGDILTLYRRHPAQLTKDWRIVEQSWSRMIDGIRRTAAQELRTVEPEARSRMYHYFANLAHEDEEFSEGLRLLWLGLQSSPWTSLVRVRSWFLAAACVSGCLLPLSWHRELERVCTQWGRAIYSWIGPE
jgi:glycosyltransferase involved in cell wall biosynthesis